MLKVQRIYNTGNKYYSSAGHYEQKNKKTTRRTKILAVTVKQQIKLLLQHSKGLTEIPGNNFLTTDQVTYFVTNNIYEKSKPNECFLEFLEESIKPFSSEIEKFIAIAYQNLQVVSIHRTVQYLNLVHPQSLSLLVMF